MENIQNLMSGIIFNILLSCVLFLILVLLSVDQSNVTAIDFNLLLNLDCLLTYLIICYIYCHFSENMTTKSFEIGDIVYNSFWYKMSIKEQKIIILMIQQSQKEFRLSGLGLIDCSLATFLTVTINFFHFQFQCYLMNNKFL